MNMKNTVRLSEVDRSAIFAAQAEACKVLGVQVDWASASRAEVPRSSDMASIIEHTILRQTAGPDDVRYMCGEVIKYGFYGICVNPALVQTAAQCINSRAAVISVVAFPFGATTTSSKRLEAAGAIEDGANEVDMVGNLGLLRSKDLIGFTRDIRSVVEELSGAPVKVIIEAGFLSSVYECALASCLAVLAGASFVKTSTGFAFDMSGKHPLALGATQKDVAVISAAIGSHGGVKAAGGIRTFETAAKMVAAGATRIGTSAGKAIVIGLWRSLRLTNRPPPSRIPPSANRPLLEVLLNNSYTWFIYHAGQRMQNFYFFLGIQGALVAFIGLQFDHADYGVFVIISGLGALAAIAFGILEVRNTELVEAGRKSIDEIEDIIRLRTFEVAAESTRKAAWKLPRKADIERTYLPDALQFPFTRQEGSEHRWYHGLFRHGLVFRVILTLCLAAWIGFAFYAGFFYHPIHDSSCKIVFSS